MSIKQIIASAVASWLLVVSPGSTSAQPPVPGSNQPPQPAANARVLEQEQIRPAFRAEPIVHRLEARRGQELRFEFVLHSLGRPTTLSIKPVAITQRENGTIASDETVPAPAEIRIEGPERIALGSGEDYLIKGRVRVPIVQSTFHSFGILVKDLGQVADVPRPNATNETKLAVRFVTQYLLRCDITVTGARSERLHELVVESAHLEEENGLAKLVGFVVNPTDGPMSLQTRCLISDPQAGAGSPPFFVAMPIRAGGTPPEKYDIKILAKTRLRLEEFIPHPLAGGPKEVRFEFLDGRRIGGHGTVAVNVDPIEFPAQNQNALALDDGIIAEPGRLEFSMEKGGNRLASLKLQNNTDGVVDLQLKAVNLAGVPTELLAIRPETVSLPPGKSRNVLLTLAPNTAFEDHQYARIEVVNVGSPVAEGEPAPAVPVALIARSASVPHIEIGELAWNSRHRSPALELAVKNTGKRHLPLNATAKITSIDGASMQISGGFGRWLLPGDEDKIRFRLKTIPPAGQYLLSITIDQGPSQEPIVLERSIEFAPEQADISAN